jgi:hypothetical protein
MNGYLKLLVVLPVTIAVLYFSYKETKSNFYHHKAKIVRLNDHLSVLETINKEYRNKPTLVIPNYYGAPYKEYGLYFGLAWSGSKMANVYAKDLRILYPDIYIHHGWNNLFNAFGTPYSYIDLLKKYKKIVLYSGDDRLEKSLSSKLSGINRKRDTKIVSMKSFESIGARVYEIEIDTNKIKIPMLVSCNSESRDSSLKFFVNSEGLRFANGETQSDEKARSGNYSSKLEKGKAYGFTVDLSEVMYKEKYKISVWRYNNGNVKAGIVIMTQKPDIFYSIYHEAIADGEWSKIDIEFEIPAKIHTKDLKIYCWNPDKELPAYFDDFTIEEVKVEN